MGDRRRPRSPSPDRYRRDRSPPYEKRFRGDEYDRGVGGGRGRRGGYARGPEDRRRTGRDEPVSFREFALSLDDSVGVEEAGVQYKQYLADFWGGSVKAEFEQRKNDPSLRQQFDPRELRKALEQRWEAVRAAAAAFAKQGPHADLDSLGPGPTGWRGRLAGEAGDAHLELATALVAKLDAEAGVGAGGDDPAHPSGDHATPAAAEAGNAGPEAGAGPASSGAAEAGDAVAAPDPEAVATDASPAPGPAATGAAGEGVLERLDAARRYLWAAFQGRLHRHWQHRLDHGEAAQAAMREEYVEAGVTQFIEDAIVKHEDNKWGNKLSAKLFVAREFVEKHIRNKHAHVLAGGAGAPPGHRGNRGGRGGGGRGGFNGGPIFMAPGSGGKPGGPAPNQEYFDLDAPKNNRAVLDYGDL
ncbi:hypothetical protein F751_2794 [Auxenochlorella protothecoides]|uniref:SERRATE/Ars2 C-terminal domain-containing protein n=1 Tax=Auxenochlorella protothecoides TaxID=3075 RepID=A0A087SPZ9_AUXPR|nr:hypothetical protein F751_2794 [Auxenochlorella protothecoides]KFM27803.1 hypothetical protein F751_2794 [Auxenochlorella protothecoides]